MAETQSSMNTPEFGADNGSDNISHRTPDKDRPDDAGAVWMSEKEWKKRQGDVEPGTVVGQSAQPLASPTTAPWPETAPNATEMPATTGTDTQPTKRMSRTGGASDELLDDFNHPDENLGAGDQGAERRQADAKGTPARGQKPK